jgi:hypothetical protein
MTSKERMLAALSCGSVDYTPCSFMLFFNLYDTCRNDTEFVEKQVEMGLDPYAHAGFLEHSLHPDAEYSEWVERKDGDVIFCRKIDTPAGPLTGRVRQRNNWPQKGAFPLFDDWIVPRAEEVLVKPEQDLEKVKYIFGPFSNESIEKLKTTAKTAQQVADKHQLLLAGGWKGVLGPGRHSDMGVMGCDAMAWLSGYVDIMTLSLTNPDLIRAYAEIIHNWNAKQLEIYLDVTDPELLIRRAWYETTEFWTPDAYHHIIYPYLKKEAELVHQAGKKYGYIITSAFLPLLDDIIDAGVDVIIGLDPEEGKGTDFKEIKRKMSDNKRAIWGGVSGAMTVEQGSAEDTEKAVKEALQLLGKDGGFILSPVDNVREDNENARTNTKVFIDTWKQNR